MPEEKTPTMNYDTEPIYVLQLVDYTGEVSYFAVSSSQSSSSIGDREV